MRGLRVALLLSWCFLDANVRCLCATPSNWGFRRRPRVAILTLAGNSDGADGPSAVWQQGFQTLDIFSSAS